MGMMGMNDEGLGRRYLLGNLNDVNPPSSLPCTPSPPQTALHLACQASATEVIRTLIGQGAAVNAQCDQGRSPLHISCATGSLRAVRLLLGQGGIEVGARDTRGWTPLFEAAARGFIKIVKALLAHGADPRILSADGQSASFYAARNGFEATARLIFSWRRMRRQTNRRSANIQHVYLLQTSGAEPVTDRHAGQAQSLGVPGRLSGTVRAQTVTLGPIKEQNDAAVPPPPPPSNDPRKASVTEVAPDSPSTRAAMSRRGHRTYEYNVDNGGDDDRTEVSDRSTR